LHDAKVSCQGIGGGGSEGHSNMGEILEHQLVIARWNDSKRGFKI